MGIAKNILVAVLAFASLLQLQAGEVRKPKAEKLWGRGWTRVYHYPAPDSIDTKLAVIVCPGGSYAHTMGIYTEGHEVADWFNRQGISAYVLRYRTGSVGAKYPDMMEDFQMAMALARERSNYIAVGVVGFSAGGHLALMSAEQGGLDFLNGRGRDSKLSPDFVAAIYPVVSMQDEIVHERSRKNLLGLNLSEETKALFSMELNVPDDMPPTFISACEDDAVVMYRNSVLMDKALEDKGIPHIFAGYKEGGHGYGSSEEKAPVAARWKYDFLNFILGYFRK